MTPTPGNEAIWAIALLAAIGVILRPWRLPQAVWAGSGALLLVVFRLLPPDAALRGVARGTDVYLFLFGMMVLAEIGRKEGFFDFLAALAAHWARGSALRLFTLIYLVGVLVTVFLSNDATAIVLTPAVASVASAARIREPLPYLLTCALIANAASFVLPISNPANLVIYGRTMPPLMEWLGRYGASSLASVGATYVILYLFYYRSLNGRLLGQIDRRQLSPGGKTAAFGILATALVLLGASSAGLPLGLPTCLAGIGTASAVLLRRRQGPIGVIRAVSWDVLLLVAGLFVLVEALDRTGLLHLSAAALHDLAARSTSVAAWSAGGLLAVACNLMNNLPAGLIAGSTVQAADLPPQVTGAVLIATDLGPNLSITGSLATILWLAALRRDGHEVTAWRFLKLGAVAMPPALILALLAQMLAG